VLAPSAFLRLDAAELHDGNLVIRAIDTATRKRSQQGGHAPLAYLYEIPDADEPETDMLLAAGHFDPDAMVWRFSGDVPGILGLTEPTSPAEEMPSR
jgi:hypothetical protein